MGITKTALFTTEQNTLAQVFKVLAHPARLAILQHLSASKSCVTGAIVAEVKLAQPTISQHLKELKSIGLIQGTIEGAAICYCINPEKWDALQAAINNLFTDHHPNRCC